MTLRTATHMVCAIVACYSTFVALGATRAADAESMGDVWYVVPIAGGRRAPKRALGDASTCEALRSGEVHACWSGEIMPVDWIDVFDARQCIQDALGEPEARILGKWFFVALACRSPEDAATVVPDTASVGFFVDMDLAATPRNSGRPAEPAAAGADVSADVGRSGGRASRRTGGAVVGSGDAGGSTIENGAHKVYPTVRAGPKVGAVMWVEEAEEEDDGDDSNGAEDDHNHDPERDEAPGGRPIRTGDGGSTPGSMGIAIAWTGGFTFRARVVGYTTSEHARAAPIGNVRMYPPMIPLPMAAVEFISAVGDARPRIACTLAGTPTARVDGSAWSEAPPFFFNATPARGVKGVPAVFAADATIDLVVDVAPCFGREWTRTVHAPFGSAEAVIGGGVDVGRAGEFGLDRRGPMGFVRSPQAGRLHGTAGHNIVAEQGYDVVIAFVGSRDGRGDDGGFVSARPVYVAGRTYPVAMETLSALAGPGAYAADQVVASNVRHERGAGRGRADYRQVPAAPWRGGGNIPLTARGGSDGTRGATVDGGRGNTRGASRPFLSVDTVRPVDAVNKAGWIDGLRGWGISVVVAAKHGDSTVAVAIASHVVCLVAAENAREACRALATPFHAAGDILRACIVSGTEHVDDWSRLAQAPPEWSSGPWYSVAAEGQIVHSAIILARDFDGKATGKDEGNGGSAAPLLGTKVLACAFAAESAAAGMGASIIPTRTGGCGVGAMLSGAHPSDASRCAVVAAAAIAVDGSKRVRAEIDGRMVAFSRCDSFPRCTIHVDVVVYLFDGGSSMDAPPRETPGTLPGSAMGTMSGPPLAAAQEPIPSRHSHRPLRSASQGGGEATSARLCTAMRIVSASIGGRPAKIGAGLPQIRARVYPDADANGDAVPLGSTVGSADSGKECAENAVRQPPVANVRNLQLYGRGSSSTLFACIVEVLIENATAACGDVLELRAALKTLTTNPTTTLTPSAALPTTLPNGGRDPETAVTLATILQRTPTLLHAQPSPAPATYPGDTGRHPPEQSPQMPVSIERAGRALAMVLTTTDVVRSSATSAIVHIFLAATTAIVVGLVAAAACFIIAGYMRDRHPPPPGAPVILRAGYTSLADEQSADNGLVDGQLAIVNGNQLVGGGQAIDGDQLIAGRQPPDGRRIREVDAEIQLEPLRRQRQQNADISRTNLAGAGDMFGIARGGR